jgi:glycosyltransferase involved in cell wall biosynthesis
VPARRASSVQVMRMCNALVRAGHDVVLVAKAGREPTDTDDHAFYGVSRAIEIVKVPRPAWRGGGVVFTAGMAREIARRWRDSDLVYSRDLAGAAIAAEMRLPVVFEAHGIPSPTSARWLLRRVSAHHALRGLVVISRALEADLAAQGYTTRAPIVVAPDAADLGAASERRRGPHIRVGYVGNLYAGRGIELVLELARRLPAHDVEIVGGTAREIERFQHDAPPNLTFRGFVEPAKLADVYASFDIVLMPYPRSGIGVASGKSDTSRWCSPMKMFEYMASGAAIVSSDLPVLQEVLSHERNALIAPAGDVDAWHAAIERLATDRELRSRLAATARDDLATHYTWDARVRRITGELGLS